MKYTRLKFVIFLAASFCYGLIGTGWAQDAQPTPPASSPPGAFERESLHMNTIGTYSAGFILQSYGYIGLLADVLSNRLYEEDQISSMLNETITFLNKAINQLDLYQNENFQFSSADKQFISGINLILKDLTAEAQALSDFAKSHDKEDLERFNESRKKAWAGIKKTLGVN
jgi:hypothetical protein